MTKQLLPQTWFYFNGEVAGDYCCWSSNGGDVFEVSEDGLLKGDIMGMTDMPFEQLKLSTDTDNCFGSGCNWDELIPLPTLLKAANLRLDLTMLVRDMTERVIQEPDYDSEKWFWFYHKILVWYNHTTCDCIDCTTPPRHNEY
jgi:hypothetical protein